MVPVVVGEKLTRMVQLALAPNEAPQGVPPPATAVKSPLPVEAMLIDAAVLFASVRVDVLLVLPTVQPPKFTLLGEIVSGRIAVPLTSKISGVTVALSVSPIAPLIDPLADGVKVTDSVQVAAGNRVVMQPEAV